MIWLVDSQAEQGRDYDLEKLLPFWLLTAQQDWAICANQQRGVNSHAYTPGPLSTYKEYNLERFLRWYVQEMKTALENEKHPSRLRWFWNAYPGCHHGGRAAARA